MTILKSGTARAGVAALFAVVAAGASASTTPVDLSGWVNEGQGVWNVAADNNSVNQIVNGEPTVFFDPTSTGAQGTFLSGTIEVQTGSDDDMIGFVLGYQSGELSSATADFWIIDWKQGNQGSAPRGLALTHVMGDLSGSGTEAGFWDHGTETRVDAFNEVARGANLGSTGWADLTSYDFEISFTASEIGVKVDGVQEILYTHGSAINDGAFAFYNYSQSNVRYAGIQQGTVSPVPLPAGLPLMLAGLGGIALLRRRKV